MASMTTSQAEAASPHASQRLSALAVRLCPPMPGSRAWGWIGPLLVTAFGTFLRFNRLSLPPAVVFDETYYVPDAFGILKYGTEHNYIVKRNPLIVRGDPHFFTKGGEFVAHPPFGKIMIAAGEWIFGLTPFGWRFAVAVVGSLSILMISRIARRMTRSTLLGCIAGLLLSLDGLEFVMSRTALLDIFVMFWVLAAFGCIVIDRDRTRARLAEAMTRYQPDVGPKLGIRWWRVAAGVCIGLATASKWNGVWYMPAFGALVLAWDLGARRTAGVARWVYGGLVKDGLGALACFGAVPFVTYILAWSNWLFTKSGYDRFWAEQHGIHTPVIDALVSLYQYNLAMLHFDDTLATKHPYESQPWTWLVIHRPVSFYYAAPKAGHSGCHVLQGCSSEVLAIGTPMIWWVSIATLLICVAWWLTQRDWRAGAVVVGFLGGWLPWFLYLSRTKFYFYAVAYDPFLVLSITLCLGLLIGAARAGPVRRVTGAAVTGGYLLAVMLNFYYLYPVLAAKVIPYSSWLARMWFNSWI